jgi:hypothetical protein
VLLVLLGAWGALIPFIGPYLNYAYSPDRTWTYSTGRLWLEILPGAAVFLGGLIVLAAATRPVAVFGAWLAALAGGWFVVGMPLSTLWTSNGTPDGGYAVGGTVTRAMENIGFFSGLGAVIIFFAAMALGRFTVIGVREATRAAEQAEPEPATQQGVWEPAPPQAGSAAETTQADPALTADRPAGMTGARPWARHSAEDAEPPA